MWRLHNFPQHIVISSSSMNICKLSPSTKAMKGSFVVSIEHISNQSERKSVCAYSSVADWCQYQWCLPLSRATDEGLKQTSVHCRTRFLKGNFKFLRNMKHGALFKYHWHLYTTCQHRSLLSTIELSEVLKDLICASRLQPSTIVLAKCLRRTKETEKCDLFQKVKVASMLRAGDDASHVRTRLKMSHRTVSNRKMRVRLLYLQTTQRKLDVKISLPCAVLKHYDDAIWR